MRTFVTFIAGLALSVGLVSPAHAATRAEYEREIVSATNAWRGTNGLVALKKSPCLEKKADAWAKHLATEVKELKHRSSSNLRKVLKQCKKSSIGENLAVGYSSGTAVVEAWKSSSGHNRNLLKSDARWYGVGAYYRGGRWWSVQLIAR